MNLINRFSLYATLALFISACTGIPTQSVDTTPADDGVTAAPTDALPAQETPRQFVELASQTFGIERDQHLIRAAELYIETGDFDAAQMQLQGIDAETTDSDVLGKMQILSAHIALGKGDPRQALKLLPLSTILPPQLQMQVYEIRARAFLDAGYPLESAKTRVQLDKLISDEFDSQRNHQAIWEALSLLPETTLNQLSLAPLHVEFLGWVELAKVAKRGQIDWQHLQDGIYNWRKRYPEHPAAKIFIQELGSKQIELMDRPGHIAVLLPFSGQYSQVASAIRDGFMAAYYQHPDKTLRPKISFIDTSNNPTAIWNHYRQAVDDGADFIVGPFMKSAVNSLSRSTRLELPTLTLNYASEQDSMTQNLFQFGLLPEDEARQSAEMAYRQGNIHAAVLVPEGTWGQRLSTAFQQRFEELGGTVINRQTYTPGTNDFKRPIQSLLNISQSHARHRKLKNLLKTDLKFTPYRRQDVDMIFIAATPKDARQLKPQFKFHYAGELPVFATSHAYTGKLDSQADRDIDELYYCDMPWILSPPNRLKQSLINYWPEQERYTRFFALGTDAYNLIPFMGRLQAKSYERFSGQTGNLYLDPFKRLHRELLWAQFIRGVPTLVDLNKLPETITLDQAEPPKQ
ncbi:MAG: penicillin-binding protein activator [Gammaproteobacteria bacterium]|nr:penicillin-binding protein activator [Gammaproteobacteria bacterium]